MKNLRTYLPHTRVQGGFRIVQIIGGKHWSLAIYLKPRTETLR